MPEEASQGVQAGQQHVLQRVRSSLGQWKCSDLGHNSEGAASVVTLPLLSGSLHRHAQEMPLI